MNRNPIKRSRPSGEVNTRIVAVRSVCKLRDYENAPVFLVYVENTDVKKVFEKMLYLN
jgi:hypothetical protein